MIMPIEFKSRLFLDQIFPSDNATKFQNIRALFQASPCNHAEGISVTIGWKKSNICEDRDLGGFAEGTSTHLSSHDTPSPSSHTLGLSFLGTCGPRSSLMTGRSMFWATPGACLPSPGYQWGSSALGKKEPQNTLRPGEKDQGSSGWWEQSFSTLAAQFYLLGLLSARLVQLQSQSQRGWFHCYEWGTGIRKFFKVLQVVEIHSW